METIVIVVTACFIISFFALMGFVIKAQFSELEKMIPPESNSKQKVEPRLDAIIEDRTM